MFQNGTGVPRDYAKAMSWFDKAAAQGNSEAENQLGWMYQFGQGMEADDARALTWYQLSADQGNTHGKNNLQALTDDLEDRSEESANSSVNDAAIAQAQRWANIEDLHRRINEVEADAQNQDDIAAQLEGMSKGKNDAISKIFKVMGSAGAVKYHIQSDKDRDEAARLRDELARTENQGQSFASVPEP
jgi:hypothetical protein